MGRWTVELDARWHALAEEVIIGMKEWRLQHPRATFRAIEAALDERWAKVRARMLQDAALLSAAADLRTASANERPVCPPCGRPLEARGQATRALTTTYNQPIRLTRR